jgi:putative endonuclease
VKKETSTARSRRSREPGLERKIGDRAERAAEAFLESQGFVILERKLHVGRFEIDLLARSGALLVIAEVRTRGEGSFERALQSVDEKKRARLVAAADRLWRERFKDDASVERMRFDVLGVRLEGERAEVEHIPGAFTA